MLQPILDVILYTVKLTGAIGAQVSLSLCSIEDDKSELASHNEIFENTKLSLFLCFILKDKIGRFPDSKSSASLFCPHLTIFCR